MSSPKTPTNASANEEQEEPQSLFKRTLNLFFGSNKKQKTSSAPSSTASSNQIQNETRENGNIMRNLNPVLVSSNFTSPVTFSTNTNNNMNTTPTVQTPTAIPGVKPFHVGSAAKPAARTFKKITFRSDVKTPNLKGNSSFSTKPLRKATPFGKQKRVSFGGSNQRTPAKSATTPFRKTPFKAKSTPSKVHSRYRSELMSTPLVPSNSTPKTKLGAISQSHISDVAKSIMEQQSTSISAYRLDQQEDELFTNPTEKRQKRALAITKSYGSQVEGSRISKANDIQARRVSAGNGAFRSGPSPKGNDYWSNFQDEEDYVQEQSQTPKPPSASDDHDFHALKRRKATTTQLSPPNGQTSFKALKTLSPTSEMKREEERKPAPFKVAPVENWIETSEGNYSRDEKGRINHGSIKMYGNTIEIGLGTKALKENRRTKTALKKSRDGEYNGLHFDFTDQKRTAAVLKSVLPYNFMPTAKAQSRKGSSSLLNKPLAHNASKISTTSSSAAPATSSQAETTAPPPSQGWGNMFKKEEGTWKCSKCTSPNPKTASSCMACETPKGEEAESTKAPPPPSQGWGNMFKKEEGTWTCLTCRSSNPKTASNCVACETPKGEEIVGEKPSEEDSGKNKKEDDSKGPTFCFDNKDSGNTSKFSFGAPASGAASSNASEGFTFGAAKTEVTNGDVPKPVTGGFTFGATSTAAKEKKDDAPKPAFSFGAPAPVAATEKKDDAPKPAFSFGAPAPVAATEKKDDAPKPAFSFGAPAPVAATEKKDDAPKPAFSYGAPAPVAATEKKDDAPKPAFSFGAPAPAAATEKKDDAPKPAFSFSAPAPAAATEKKDDAPKPVFSFGAAAPVAAPSEKTESKPTAPAFAFGSIPSKEKKDTTPVQFGSIPSADDTSSQKKKRSAGDVDTGSIAPKPAFTFGGSGSMSAPESKPAFAFGAGSTPAPSSSDNQPAFAFGASSTPALAAGGFSFGGSAPAPAAPAFGATPAAPALATPAFGAPAPAPPTMAFGTAPAPPAGFGAPAPAAGGFSFGDSAPAPAASTFGAAPAAPPMAFGAQQPAPGGGFGAPAPAATAFGATPAPGGFGAPSAPSQPAAPMGFGAAAAPPGGGFSIGTGGSSNTRGRRRIVRAKRPPPR